MDFDGNPHLQRKHRFSRPSSKAVSNNEKIPSGVAASENDILAPKPDKTVLVSSKFEKIKSEALDTWSKGFTLGISEEEKNTKKKGKGWLSAEEFFSNIPSFSSNSEDNDSSEILQSEGEYTKIKNQNKTGMKPLKWSSENAQQQPHNTVLYEYKRNYELSQRSINYPIPQMMAVPLSAFSLPYKPNQYSTIYPNLSEKNNEYCQYFYLIICNSRNTSTLALFQVKMEQILQYDIIEFSSRTFAMLLKALVPLLEYEYIKNQSITVRNIRERWQPFTFYIRRHLQSYKDSPEDITSLVKVCVFLRKYDSNILEKLPMMDIINVYTSVKDACTVSTREELTFNMKILEGISDLNTILLNSMFKHQT